MVETSDLFLSVKKENDRRQGTISHAAFYQLSFTISFPGLATDGGVCACPDLNKKNTHPRQRVEQFAPFGL